MKCLVCDPGVCDAVSLAPLRWGLVCPASERSAHPRIIWHSYDIERLVWLAKAVKATIF